MLTLLQHSPPLINLTMRRSADANQTLLDKPTEENHVKLMASKIDSQAIIASLVKGPAMNLSTRESELVSIMKGKQRSLTGPSGTSFSSKPNLSVDSFDAALMSAVSGAGVDDVSGVISNQQKINKLTRTPPLLPKSQQHQHQQSDHQKPHPRGRTTSTSSNINVSVTSPMTTRTQASPGSFRPPPSPTTSIATTPTRLNVPGASEVTWMDVDLYKQPGRGLGIAVTGGPKHIILEGIRVNPRSYFSC